MKQTEQKSSRRSWIVALAAVAVCGLLLLGVVWGIFSLNGSGKPAQTYTSEDVERYLAEQWPNYPLAQVDGPTVHVRGTAQITYAQAEKYGAISYDAQMLDSYVRTAGAIAAGLQAECGFDTVQVVLEQYSSDGQIIFTAASDGSIDVCWDQGESE